MSLDVRESQGKNGGFAARDAGFARPTPCFGGESGSFDEP
jgi:hypothetical protein